MLLHARRHGGMHGARVSGNQGIRVPGMFMPRWCVPGCHNPMMRQIFKSSMELPCHHCEMHGAMVTACQPCMVPGCQGGPCQHDTALPRCHNAMVPKHSSIPWCDDVPQCHGAIIATTMHGFRMPGCQGARVPGCHGATVPRCHGATVRASYGAIVLW